MRPAAARNSALSRLPTKTAVSVPPTTDAVPALARYQMTQGLVAPPVTTTPQVTSTASRQSQPTTAARRASRAGERYASGSNASADSRPIPTGTASDEGCSCSSPASQAAAVTKAATAWSSARRRWILCCHRGESGDGVRASAVSESGCEPESSVLPPDSAPLTGRSETLVMIPAVTLRTPSPLSHVFEPRRELVPERDEGGSRGRRGGERRQWRSLHAHALDDAGGRDHCPQESLPL